VATDSITVLSHPAVLADALTRAHWSARDLAKAINTRLHAMGQPTVDLTAGYKWLHGHVPRTAAVRDVVAVVLSDATAHRYTSTQL
jgi:hypothetical protein